MGNNQKNKNLTIRLEKNLIDNYRLICNKQGFDMSKRIRLFIEKEIEFNKLNENILNRLIIDKDRNIL